jgi:hypothetical protein
MYLPRCFTFQTFRPARCASEAPIDALLLAFNGMLVDHRQSGGVDGQ